MANQLQQAGSQGNYVPLFTDRFFLGYVTNRNKLRSPLGAYYSKFINANDAMIDGSNVEVSNRLTLIRRPGVTAGLASFLSSGNIPDVPDFFYSFHENNGVVRVFVDTPSAIYLLTSSAVSTIYTKLANAGQSYFQGVGQSLFFGDAVEQQKWIDNGSGNPGNSFSTITNVALTSNVATITAINNFAVGQTVVISNTTVSSGALNGTFVITAVTATTFSFALTHADIGSASDTGTASATWNWQIAAPTTPPTLVVTQTGSAAVAWQASTWYSTLGILIDTTNNVAMQLVSVNADGTNSSSQYGLSGNGQPAWNQTPGGTTTDNTITWTNYGPIGSWKPSTTFSGFSSAGAGGAVPAMIYDPASGGFYANSFSTSKLSGSTKPPFNGVLAGNYFDNQCNWVCYANAYSGSSPNVFKWRPGHVYPTIPPISGSVFPDGLIVEPYAPPLPNGTGYPTNQTVYAQVSGGGTSAATPYTPWQSGGVPVGVLANDKQLQWISLGSSVWQATHQYSGWSAPNNTAFNCVVDTANCLQVCNKTGISGASAPWVVWQASHGYLAGATITDTNGFIQIVTAAGTSGTPSHPVWNTTIGGTTTDNTVTWTNQGYAYGSVTNDGTTSWTNIGLKTYAVWTANQSYYLPKAGFSLPTPFDKYGGADVLDSNNNVEFALVTGTSGGSAPAWNVSKFGITIDNSQVVWVNNGAIVTGGISWTVGFGYVYSFKARSTSDRFLNSATAPHGLGDASNPGNNPLSGNPTILPAPTGSADGSVSTASPSAAVTGSNTGAIITISGLGSTDPQVDTIEIYRTSDGGATYFLLTDIVAPLPVGGVAQPWSFNDEIPDTPTSTSDGLQNLTIAPTNHFNDPPMVGIINTVQYFGRIFYSVGSTVFSSEGPLVGGAGQPAGNGFTAFNPGQFWGFPSPVTRLVPTSVGLFVFTTSDLWVISGGPAVTSLFQNILIPGLGLSSFNALAINGSIINLVTADNQCVSLDPNMGVSEVGVGIGDKINALNPATAYVAHLTQGSNDKALFVANGTTGWYRCNLNQSPDSSITGPVWSPFATINGGTIKAIGAVEYTPGKHALLIGNSSANQPILVRDSTFTTFTDNGSAYYAWATVGSIVLANPGELAELGFITADFLKVGTSPNVLVLLDEISDSYMNITAASFSAGNTTYTYTLGSGIQPVVGMTITVTGMATSGNNGTFIVTGGNLTTTFIVANAAGHTESGQTAIGTQFETLGGYHGTTGLPPQDSPMKYGLTLAPNSVFANRYYFQQSINGASPLPSCCRHLQMKIDYGSTDTVQNEVLSLTIWGKHWSESYA